MTSYVIEPTFVAWRAMARKLVLAGMAPGEAYIRDSRSDAVAPLPEKVVMRPSSSTREIRVPREFMERAPVVALHRNPRRWNLLYSVLWQLQRDRNLLRVKGDEDVIAFVTMEREVKRAAAEMLEAMQFKRVVEQGRELMVAVYKPAHYVLRLVVEGLVRRDPECDFVVYTPEESARWSVKAKKLEYAAGTEAAGMAAAERQPGMAKAIASSHAQSRSHRG